MPVKIEPLYGGGGDNVIDGSTVSGTAPSATFALSTLASGDPAQRVRWGSGSASITFTAPSPKTGGVLILPVSNADAGSGVVTLSNAAGLSVAVPIPVHTRNGIPRTAALDFSDQGNLTSNAWTLAFSGNSANLIVGGGIGIYPRKAFPGIRWDFAYKHKQAALDEMNAYLHRRRFPFRTSERMLQCSTWIDSDELAELDDVISGGIGTKPGFVWPQLAGVDAFFGLFPEFEAHRVGDVIERYAFAFNFVELSKGKPVF